MYVKIEDTIRGFDEILQGKHDDLPERAFFMKGTIEDVVRDAGGSAEAQAAPEAAAPAEEAPAEEEEPAGEAQAAGETPADLAGES